MEEEEAAVVVGRAGRAALAQSAVSDVGFTAPNPSGALHRPQYSKVTTIDWPVSSLPSPGLRGRRCEPTASSAIKNFTKINKK